MFAVCFLATMKQIGFILKFDRKQIDRLDFDDLIELPFENTIVNAPRSWEANLKRLYKNYMQYPPVDKRNSGHDVYFIDTKG